MSRSALALLMELEGQAQRANPKKALGPEASQEDVQAIIDKVWVEKRFSTLSACLVYEFLNGPWKLVRR